MVLCILVSIPDLTVYSASLFVLCMISSCAFVAGQCYNKGMAWERFARLSGFVLFACRRDWPVGLPCFSAWLSLSGPFQHWNNLCWFSKIWSLIYRVLKCECLVFSVLSRPGPLAPNRSSSHHHGSRSQVWPSTAPHTSQMWLNHPWKRTMLPQHRDTAGGGSTKGKKTNM